MELKFNIEKKHLYFLIGVILIIGIAIFVVAQQYPQQNPGHMWSEMDCDGNLCVKNGNVGIGTTNPTQALQVGRADVGNGAYDGQIVIGKTNGDDSRRLFKIGLDPSYYFSIGYYGWTGNENYDPFLTITSSGNVGIGTTDPGRELDISSATPVLRFTDSNAATIEDVGSFIEFGRGSGDNWDRAAYIGYGQSDNTKLSITNKVEGGNIALYTTGNPKGQICINDDCKDGWPSGNGNGDCCPDPNCASTFVNAAGDTMTGNLKIDIGGNNKFTFWEENDDAGRITYGALETWWYPGKVWWKLPGISNDQFFAIKGSTGDTKHNFEADGDAHHSGNLYVAGLAGDAGPVPVCVGANGKLMRCS